MATSMLNALSLLLVCTSAQVHPKKPIPPKVPAPWRTVTTPVGFTISVPTGAGVVSSTLSPQKRPEQANLTIKGWSNCTVSVSRKSIGKDEDSNDSDATKLEDFAFEQIDIESATLSSISYGVASGYPALELQGKDEEGANFRLRVIRTSSIYYELLVSGSTRPEKSVLDHVYASLSAPKEVTPGKLKTWGPTPQDCVVVKKHLSVWCPVPLTNSDDLLDFNGEQVKQIGLGGDFGYSAYNIVYAEIPQELHDRYDEDTLDKLIVSKFSVNDDGEHVKLGSFSTVNHGNIAFRTTSYSDGDIQSRVEIGFGNGKLYLFWAVVPKGLLGSDDVKHFFESITIK